MTTGKSSDLYGTAYPSPEEARRHLNVGRSMIYQLIHSRQIPAIRLGRLLWIPIASVEAFALSAREFYTIGPPRPGEASNGASKGVRG
jgi:excisionase family DNA binding protein